MTEHAHTHTDKLSRMWEEQRWGNMITFYMTWTWSHRHHNQRLRWLRYCSSAEVLEVRVIMAVMTFPITIMLMTTMIIIITVKMFTAWWRKNGNVPIYAHMWHALDFCSSHCMPFTCALWTRIKSSTKGHHYFCHYYYRIIIEWKWI